MGYLGDVTTPTGGGAGIFDQISSWFTGSVANAANAPQVVQDWLAAVKSRGNAVVRYPRADDIGTAGDLAEREALSSGGYSYYMAPPNVIAADRTTRQLSTFAPATAKVAAVGETFLNPLANVSRTVVVAAVALGAVVLGSRFIGRR